MFDALHEKLEGAFRTIRGRGVITEADIAETMKAVRMALLEADVNFRVAKDLCKEVAEQAKGETVLKSLTPDQQIIKLVHEQLRTAMGTEAVPLNLRAAPPVVIMLVGLQGSGKTTTCAKLARLLRDEHHKKLLLVPADVYRPAAIEQLKTLGGRLKIDVFDTPADANPVDISAAARDYATRLGLDVMLIDTAGRLQIDQTMMTELQNIKERVNPQEILLVADAMTGQEAVNIANGFNEALGIDGLILTKLDGDARGGAALSMRAITGKPIKFIGVGENTDALEIFHPDRLASRILGMGDVLSLIEKASKEVNLEESAKLHKKMRRNEFTLEDFLGQLKMIQRMGSIDSLLGMIPGMKKFAKQVDPQQAEREFKRIEAIILSMTPIERRQQNIIDGSRRRRIAAGSGVQVADVNRLLKQFLEMKKMMKRVTKSGLSGVMGMLRG